MKVESGSEIALVGQRVEIIMIVVVLICEMASTLERTLRNNKGRGNM